MKNLSIFLLIAFLLSSCIQSVVATSTSIPTQSSISTSIKALTPTSTPMATITSTPIALPDGVTLQIREGNVTEKDISEITEALAIIHSYLISTFSTDPILENPLTVIVIGVGEDNQAPGDLKGQCCGHMYGGKPGLFFDVQHPIWLQGDVHIPENPYMHHLHNVAHEYTHLWQNSQGCFSNPGQSTPPMRWWISEGMAEYLSAASLVNAGKLTWDQADNIWQAEDARGAPYTEFPSLKTMEFDFQGWDYSFAYLAIERLVKQSPKGISSLRDMCQNVAKGMTYSKAFQDAFGQSINTFYSDFPIYVQAELSINFSNNPPETSITFDSSACISQFDKQVECLGLIDKNSMPTYVFKIPFDIPGEIFDWTVESNCKIVYLGKQGDSSTHDNQILISVDKNTNSLCVAKFKFPDNQQVTVEFVTP